MRCVARPTGVGAVSSCAVRGYGGRVAAAGTPRRIPCRCSVNSSAEAAAAAGAKMLQAIGPVPAEAWSYVQRESAREAALAQSEFAGLRAKFSELGVLDGVADLMGSIQRASGGILEGLDQVVERIRNVVGAGLQLPADVLFARETVEQLKGSLLSDGGLESLALRAGMSTTDFEVALVGVIGFLLVVFSSVVTLEQAKANPIPKVTTLPTKYDPAAIGSYYSLYPGKTMARTTALLGELGSFGISLLKDLQGGEWESNMYKRAAELRELISRQGPAFVKLGQAIAIRPDILPAAYLEELQKLLDQVAPFDSTEARGILERNLGRDPAGIFVDMSSFEEPIASASIGQVYKAELKGQAGEGPVTVAVKVQRPDMLETVSLDLLLVRRAISAVGLLPNKQLKDRSKSLLAVIDLAATRFMEELDYELEMENSIRFADLMGAKPLVGRRVITPQCFREFSSRTVLVQEWVDGVKLADLETETEAGKAEVLSLVRTLLQSYMYQFLDTGFLHADPHPGNFLVTPKGELCILDYGMMTEVSPDQRLAFVEYMAKLSARDYEDTLVDLVKLGFISQELYDDPEKRALVAPAIADTLKVLYDEGGGMDVKTEKLQTSRLNVLSDELEELAKEYPVNIPPYFLLILRAFGTLEGLGLGVDRNFAIVDECFPYIARRLLTDDSPRMKQALLTFVYGDADQLKIERINMMADGFKNFVDSMDKPIGGRGGPQPVKVDAATKDAMLLLVSKEGNFVQELVVDEMVRAVDALSREAVLVLWRLLGNSVPLTAFANSPLILVPGLNALPLLSLAAARSTNTIKLSEEDEASIETVKGILSIVGILDTSTGVTRINTQVFRGMANASLTNAGVSSIQDVATIAREIGPIAPQLAEGIAGVTQKFAQKLIARMLRRLAEDLEGDIFLGPRLS